MAKSTHLPKRFRQMTLGCVAATLEASLNVVEAFDSMRYRTTDETVTDFEREMKRLRALLGLGPDPYEVESNGAVCTHRGER